MQLEKKLKEKLLSSSGDQISGLSRRRKMKKIKKVYKNKNHLILIKNISIMSKLTKEEIENKEIERYWDFRSKFQTAVGKINPMELVSKEDIKELEKTKHYILNAEGISEIITVEELIKRRFMICCVLHIESLNPEVSKIEGNSTGGGF